MSKAMILLATLGLCALQTGAAWAQSGRFTRLAGDSPSIAANTFVHILDNGSTFTDNPPQISEANDVSAMLSSLATIQRPAGQGTSQAGGIAKCLTPTAGETHIPTVEVSMDSIQVTDVSTAETQVHVLSSVENSGSASAPATFQLNFSEPTNGAIFFGSLYLVGIEQIIETVGPTTPPSYANTSVTDVQHNVQAGIAISGGGTFQVQAQYSLDDDEWQITGNLPGDVMIDETAAGVNRLFSFSIPIEDGATVTFFSTSNTRTPELVIAEAVESNAHASVTANLHASAWGYATADGMLLEDGDIDGDGDVDDDDFGNWLPNFQRISAQR